MGDGRKRALRVYFDGKLRLDSHAAKITSDAGLLPFRELDEAFRLTEAASVMFSDPRRGKNAQHRLLAMLRQAVYKRLAGYEDVSADHAPGEADQDRGKGGPARPIRDVPTGRGGRATRFVRSYPEAHPALRRTAAVGAACLRRRLNERSAIGGGKGSECAEDEPESSTPGWQGQGRQVGAVKRLDSRGEESFSLGSSGIVTVR
jgi:hypothetical protein